MAKFNPFNTIRVEKEGSNTFDLSFDNKLTLDMGRIYPVLVQDTYPKDGFNITPQMLIRFAPMVAPIMQRINSYIHFFYVPNRILWDNWEQFLAREEYAKPYFQGTDLNPWEITVGSLWDYMGLPITDNMKEKIDAFPFLAMQFIYNEYFQDQNNDSNYIPLRDKIKELYKLNGHLTEAIMGFALGDAEIPLRAYAHDYFTSGLPFAQKGPAVTIPLTLESLVGDTTILQAKNYDDTNAATGALLTDLGLITDVTPEFVKLLGTTTIDGAGAELAGTINQLRAARALQMFYEKNARGGGRYPELMKMHFDSDINDGRINRPEYLGCIKNNVVVSEVLQTSQTSSDAALGDYAGHGVSVVGGNNIHFNCPEHGWIIGFLSVIPEASYSQGIERKFTTLACEDHFPAEFAHIGEQAVLNKELYYDNALSDNNDPFCYIPRSSQLKTNQSKIHGEFRTTLSYWHLGREFASRPTLSEEFVYVQPDEQKRIFAVTDPEVNSLFAHIYFKMNLRRRLPFFTEPGQNV